VRSRHHVASFGWTWTTNAPLGTGCTLQHADAELLIHASPPSVPVLPRPPLAIHMLPLTIVPSGCVRVGTRSPSAFQMQPCWPGKILGAHQATGHVKTTWNVGMAMATRAAVEARMQREANASRYMSALLVRRPVRTHGMVTARVFAVARQEPMDQKEHGVDQSRRQMLSWNGLHKRTKPCTTDTFDALTLGRGVAAMAVHGSCDSQWNAFSPGIEQQWLWQLEEVASHPVMTAIRLTKTSSCMTCSRVVRCVRSQFHFRSHALHVVCNSHSCRRLRLWDNTSSVYVRRVHSIGTVRPPTGPPPTHTTHQESGPQCVTARGRGCFRPASTLQQKLDRQQCEWSPPRPTHWLTPLVW